MEYMKVVMIKKIRHITRYSNNKFLSDWVLLCSKIAYIRAAMDF